MSLKRSLRSISSLVNGVIIIFFSLLIFFLADSPGQVSSHMYPITPVFSTGQTTTTGKKLVPGIPVRLKIPTIKVNAFLEQVGLTKKGAVDVPKGGVNAAWFTGGPRPGRVGNAVIVGHYGTWKTGQGSVFDNLQKLHTGDKVYIEDGKGVTISFVVTQVKRYSPTAIVPEIFTSKDGKSHLNIITCDGAWNKNTKHYPNRLVVFTDKE